VWVTTKEVFGWARVPASGGFSYQWVWGTCEIALQYYSQYHLLDAAMEGPAVEGRAGVGDGSC
jgi:hypothetical protein